MDDIYLFAGFLSFAGILGYSVVRMAKHYIGKELKVQTIVAALTKVGIKKVDAKFFNDLTNEGMTRMLTTVYNVMQFERQLNPVAASFGGSKAMQDLLGIAQMQQQLGGKSNAESTGNQFP